MTRKQSRRMQRAGREHDMVGEQRFAVRQTHADDLSRVVARADQFDDVRIGANS